MTEEQIEIKSREYAEGRGHEHYNFLFEENCGSPVDFARLCYADGLKDGATEVTKELQEDLEHKKIAIQTRKTRIKELEAQIEKMKKYGKLLQDICDVMGNDPYMVWRGLEQRVLILWDKSEEEEGLKMAENILDRLLKIKPHEWTEIDEWEIK